MGWGHSTLKHCRHEEGDRVGSVVGSRKGKSAQSTGCSIEGEAGEPEERVYGAHARATKRTL
jgi:hypothetical protein